MTRLVDIVSSRVKAELLRLLFISSDVELHLRELVRQSRLSLGTVQQELRRLTRVGLVGARKDGNRVYYRANSAHPVFPDLHALVLKTDGFASVLGRALDVPGVEVAFIFGSVAKGEATAGSDVDVMILGTIGLRRISALLSGASERLGREINPHVMTVREFVERRARHDHFVSSLLKQPRIFIKGADHELEAMGG